MRELREREEKRKLGGRRQHKPYKSGKIGQALMQGKGTKGKKKIGQGIKIVSLTIIREG